MDWIQRLKEFPRRRPISTAEPSPLLYAPSGAEISRAPSTDDADSKSRFPVRLALLSLLCGICLFLSALLLGNEFRVYGVEVIHQFAKDAFWLYGQIEEKIGWFWLLAGIAVVVAGLTVALNQFVRREWITIAIALVTIVVVPSLLNANFEVMRTRVQAAKDETKESVTADMNREHAAQIVLIEDRHLREMATARLATDNAHLEAMNPRESYAVLVEKRRAEIIGSLRHLVGVFGATKIGIRCVIGGTLRRQFCSDLSMLINEAGMESGIVTVQLNDPMGHVPFQILCDAETFQKAINIEYSLARYIRSPIAVMQFDDQIGISIIVVGDPLYYQDGSTTFDPF